MKFLLLLDTSGSMYGEKITGLNLAVENLLEGFKDLALQEPPQIAAVTFGGEPTVYPFAPVEHFEQVITKWEAGGKTRFHEAIKSATELTTDETITLIITDGAICDTGFDKIKLRGRIYCMPMGYDADIELLEKSAIAQIISPVEAQHLAGYWYARYAK